MQFMETTDRILKQDAAGRVWTPPEQREAILDEFEKSGLPATKFAAHVGIKYQTFVAWVQKRRKQRSGASAASAEVASVPQLGGWVEAMVEKPLGATPGGLMVQLPGGARLEVNNEKQAMLAAAVLRAFGGGGAAC
jgi:hypothetical protein